MRDTENDQKNRPHDQYSKNMKHKNHLLLIIFLVLSFVACDPSSSVSYIIKNQTGKTVIVKLKPDIGYCTHHSGGVDKRDIVNDSVILFDTEYLEKTYEWIHSSPQPHIPLWDGIEFLYIGTNIISEDKWKNKDVWLYMIEKKSMILNIKHLS
jgi:hypothetical protein